MCPMRRMERQRGSMYGGKDKRRDGTKKLHNYMKQSENEKNDKKRQWGGNNNNTGAKDGAESDITREGGQPSATPSPDTNRSQRSSSISHNPVFPSQLCPIEIISFQNKKVII